MTCLQLLRTNRTVLVPLWGAHLGLSDALISATFAAGALLDVAMFLPSGRWMDRYGRLAGILPSLFIMGASLVVIIVWTSPVGFVVGTCLMGFGNGFGSGIVMTMGADLAPVVGRERFLGWWQGIGNIGAAAGPFVVSALTATFGLAAGMWATALLGVGGGTWAWIAMPRAYARIGIDLRGQALTAAEGRGRLSYPGS
jgi:MFS transporter